MEFWNSFELEVITQAKEQAHTLIAKELSKITSALDAITVQNASLQEKLAKALILLNQNGVKFDAKDFEIISINGAVRDRGGDFSQPNSCAADRAIKLQPIDLSKLFTTSIEDCISSNNLAISISSLSKNVAELNMLIASLAQTSASKSSRLQKISNLQCSTSSSLSVVRVRQTYLCSSRTIFLWITLELIV